MKSVHKSLLVGNILFAINKFPVPPKGEEKYKVDGQFNGAGVGTITLDTVHLSNGEVKLNFLGVKPGEEIIVDASTLRGSKHQLFGTEKEAFQFAVDYVKGEEVKAERSLKDFEVEKSMLEERLEQAKAEIKACQKVIKGLRENQEINSKAFDDLMKKPVE